MVFAVLPVLNVHAFTAEAASVTISGRITDDEVNLRRSASSDSESVGLLNRGAKLTLYMEVFTSSTSDAAEKRWYKVTAGNKKGFVRADFVEISNYNSKAAVSTDVLNYRKGPATTFGVIGTMGTGAQMRLLLPAKRLKSKERWYRVRVNGNTGYVIKDYVKLGKSPFITKSRKQLEGKSDLAKALLSYPAGGGEARVVYTFSPSNCKRMFSIKGYKNAKVPQGLAFTGSKYYILYGMAAGQAIVTYSANGKTPQCIQVLLQHRPS